MLGTYTDSATGARTGCMGCGELPGDAILLASLSAAGRSCRLPGLRNCIVYYKCCLIVLHFTACELAVAKPKTSDGDREKKKQKK